jgi:hypothetical protein
MARSHGEVDPRGRGLGSTAAGSGVNAEEGAVLRLGGASFVGGDEGLVEILGGDSW